MFGLAYNNFIYVKVAKNGCMTYEKFLKDNSWEQVDLNYITINSDTILFGHITDPNLRHTRGIVQYLLNSNLLSLIDNLEFNKLLVSGVFDEHCYSISMMIPTLVDRVHWIPLDYSWRHFNGDYLTNLFFKQNKLNLHYNGLDRQNVADTYKRSLYNKIDSLKLKYNNEYQKIVKNFLENDVKKYVQAIDYYNHIDLDAIE